VDAPLALYRRYRPETFAEVIGQDHVTSPLRAALASDRAHHAYLFSGPRGCGKTTSARILARALNCERAPVPEPCGECGSCVDLARGGPGSVDVIEIDAASHGGVDDARDLREKAFFSPVNSRYKIYVIDEAHMVSTQGFNALLKLVEEPPPHLKFVFATTEPEKVIGTIRSRTHHYPFRLVPPRLLTDYLSTLCDKEGVPIESTALPLVVRAGAGSVRDTLSVLDQLIGGSGTEGVTYQLAASLLGYTPDSLLDDVVDAFAAGDGASVFGAVDKVIESGQEPRRFAEDLLQRLRDLIIVSAVPGAMQMGLLDASEDAAARLESQAALLGPAELTRAAEVVSKGLDEIRGATAPRLLLELICARVLLPGADHGSEGVLARLDRLERRLTIAGGAPSTAATAAVEARVHETEPPLLGSRSAHSGPPAPPSPPPGRVEPSQPEPVTERARPEPVTQERRPPEPARTEPSSPERVRHPGAERSVVDRPASDRRHRPPRSRRKTAAAPATAATVSGGLGLVDVRRLWPDVLDAVKVMRRYAWVMLSQNASVHSLDGTTLTIALVNAGARDSFVGNGANEILRQALIDKLGVDWRVEAIVDPSAGSSPQPGSRRPARRCHPCTRAAGTTQRSSSSRAGPGGNSGGAGCDTPHPHGAELGAGRLGAPVRRGRAPRRPVGRPGPGRPRRAARTRARGRGHRGDPARTLTGARMHPPRHAPPAVGSTQPPI
jgi:DNA polymerase-3 subunit gamma/tau